MTAPRVTLAAVDAAIRAAGGSESLAVGRGRAYFYFYGGSAFAWAQSAVYVSRLSALSVDGWVAEWRRLRAEYLADERS